MAITAWFLSLHNRHSHVLRIDTFHFTGRARSCRNAVAASGLLSDCRAPAAQQEGDWSSGALAVSQAESVLQPPGGAGSSGLPHGAHHVSTLEMQMGIHHPHGMPHEVGFNLGP